MGTAMDNENQNENNRKSEPEQSSSQENIPLWLQGLDNSEAEDKDGASNEKQPEGAWKKELNDTPEENPQEDKNPEKILPDWLSKLSDVEPEMPKIMDDQIADELNVKPEVNKSKTEISDAEEITEKVEIKNSPVEDVSEPDISEPDISEPDFSEPDVSEPVVSEPVVSEPDVSQPDVSEPMDAPVNEDFKDEGFIEISEMDLTEKPNPDQLAFEEGLSEAEELPYWLKDMIVEQPGESYPNKVMTYAEIVALSKEDTKPIKVAGETDVSEEELPEDQLLESERSEEDVFASKHAEKPIDAVETEEASTIVEDEEPEEPVEAESLAEKTPDVSQGDDTKPIKPLPGTSDHEDISGSETDQPVPVDEESTITDLPLDSSPVQEESEDLIEIDQDRWVEKEVADQPVEADLQAPARWLEQEPVEEETQAPDQWLEQEPAEEISESETSQEWPDQKTNAQDTALEAPDQWLGEEPTGQETAPEETDTSQEQQQVQEEAEPSEVLEQELPEAVQDRLDGEETEEVKVKESDLVPEPLQEQEDIEQPLGPEQDQPETMAEKEQGLPIETPEALLEDVQVTPEDAEQPGGTPKSLRFAKYLLDQGDFDRAKEIFKPFIEKNEFLEDIETWLVEASNNGAKKHSGTWELIGDIAMAKSHPNRAFEAYKQAITVLLSTKKEINETD